MHLIHWVLNFSAIVFNLFSIFLSPCWKFLINYMYSAQHLQGISGCAGKFHVNFTILIYWLVWLICFFLLCCIHNSLLYLFKPLWSPCQTVAITVIRFFEEKLVWMPTKLHYEQLWCKLLSNLLLLKRPDRLQISNCERFWPILIDWWVNQREQGCWWWCLSLLQQYTYYFRLGQLVSI